MSKRKPFNEDAGYKASLRTPFGHAVIYDRENGGDWIDADTRWVVAAYDSEHSNLAIMEASSLRIARETMKGAREHGFQTDWIQFPEQEAA